MAIYGNLKDYRFGDEADDIRGSNIYGLNDEKLGEIDDVIFDHSTGDLKYVVVDTGGWLSSNKFLVPARQLTIREEGDDDYHVNLSKKQIETLPQYQEDAVEREEDFRDYETRYEASYSDSGDILQREGSTHLITPTPDEMPAARGSAGSFTGENQVGSPKPIARDQPYFGATSSSDTVQNPGLIGDRPLEPEISEPVISRSDSFAGRPSQNTEEGYTGVDRDLSQATGETRRDAFASDGTLRSEYDANAGTNSGVQASREAPFDSGRAPVGERRRWARDGKRFKEFQERLRKEREEIIRRKDDRKAA